MILYHVEGAAARELATIISPGCEGFRDKKMIPEGRAAMSLGKLCFCTMLAAMITFVAVGRLNVQSKDVDVRTSNSQPDDPPIVFLPVQSRNAKNLGVGKLLVSSRNLGDPNFAETVILLVHYDAEGVVGLILNRRTEVSLSRVLQGIRAAKDRSDPVYFGGPVETPVVFGLLQSPTKVEGAEHIFGGVYLITTKSLLEQSISARPDSGSLHVYLGYAGWTNEQLRKEVELGSWFIFQADAGTVFNSNPDSLWSEMIRRTELKLARSEPANTKPAAAACRTLGNG